MERIIVRRGRYHVYEILRRTFGRDQNIEIIWDRRAPISLRKPYDAREERRGRPLMEWNQRDYIFASGRRPDLMTKKQRRA